MNRTFQVAFNAARGLMTVTSEVTRRKTKIGAKAVVIGTAALLTGGGAHFTDAVKWLSKC